jgi:hypothetical protein
MRAAPVNFINRQNPNHPSGSSTTSPLSNLTWLDYTLDSEEILLFGGDAGEEYTTVPGTYRADATAAINELKRRWEPNVSKSVLPLILASCFCRLQGLGSRTVMLNELLPWEYMRTPAPTAIYRTRCRSILQLFLVP